MILCWHEPLPYRIGSCLRNWTASRPSIALLCHHHVASNVPHHGTWVCPVVLTANCPPFINACLFMAPPDAPAPEFHSCLQSRARFRKSLDPDRLETNCCAGYHRYITSRTKPWSLTSNYVEPNATRQAHLWILGGSRKPKATHHSGNGCDTAAKRAG